MGPDALNYRWAIEKMDEAGQLTGQMIGQFDHLLDAIKECQRWRLADTPAGPARSATHRSVQRRDTFLRYSSMPKSPLTLKSTVTRRPAAEPVDQAERQLQVEHHQAAENARQTAVEAATAIEPEPSGKD